MRQNIARDLDVQVEQVSVKATTTEWLGFTGRKEGVACQAVFTGESHGEAADPDVQKDTPEWPLCVSLFVGKAGYRSPDQRAKC